MPVAYNFTCDICGEKYTILYHGSRFVPLNASDIELKEEPWIRHGVCLSCEFKENHLSVTGQKREETSLFR